MLIPAYTIDGVLPPYVGPAGPGGTAEDMSPYVVTAIEVASTFATTDERKQTIETLDAAPDEPVASAALFFGGDPAIGARGIESEFAGSAVTKFQDIVAKVLAHETGGLGQRGIVPNKARQHSTSPT
jgi:hypothetical protein